MTGTSEVIAAVVGGNVVAAAVVAAAVVAAAVVAAAEVAAAVVPAAVVDGAVVAALVVASDDDCIIGHRAHVELSQQGKKLATADENNENMA